MENRLYVGRGSVRKRHSWTDTNNMKTAISIPNNLLKQAERLARHEKKSRNQLFADAVREYVARHEPDTVNQGRADEFVSAASRRILERSEW